MNTTHRIEHIACPLLQKLTDEDATHKVKINDFFQYLRRDLENLLNSRSTHLTWRNEFAELQHSSLTDGIPDFLNTRINNHDAKDRLCQKIKDAITAHEPRLNNVRVHVLPNKNDFDRLLSIRIEATVMLKPKPADAVFESSLDVVTHNFSVM